MKNNYIEIIRNEFLVGSRTAFKLGSIGDGGYFISPGNVMEALILFSGGISSNLEFEYDLFRFNKDITIVMVDPTVSRTRLLAKAIIRAFFLKKEKLRYLINSLVLILMLRSDRVFHLQKWLSSSIGILDCLREKNISIENKKILLKLDIEGSEYDLLNEILTNLDLFNCMVFEFHDLDVKHLELYDFLKKCSHSFEMIYMGINPSGGFSKTGEPKVIEITLQRKV